ncbi:hypothetical protein OIU74_013937 [Salix koriyanagi]|uniref:Uncharacterized protein n=1 Tax=Salix koriyanagi TaxID=2511006 RepID=A0A9Q0PUT0_9ROSI|nr:hypothetical protein OIU74_013937 [Salix koriyanagi]
MGDPGCVLPLANRSVGLSSDPASEDSGGRTGSGSGRQMVKGRSGGWKKERGGKRLAGGTDERKREWGQAGRRD